MKSKFSYSPQDTTLRWVSQGRHLTKKFQECSHPSGGAVVPPPLFVALHSSAISIPPVQAISKNMLQQSYHSR